MTFGDKLRQLIKEKGWSVNHALEQIGQWPTTANRWFKGEGAPAPKDLRAISRTFLVDIDWLIDDERGWDDRPPNAGSQTWLMAQVFEIVGRLGPEESLRRLKAATPKAITPEGPIILPNPRGGSRPTRPKKQGSS